MLILGLFFFFFQQEMNFFLHTNTNTSPGSIFPTLFYSILFSSLAWRRGLKIYASVNAVLVYLGSCSTINRAYFSISSRCTIHFPIAVPFLVVSVSYTCSSHTQFELHYAGGFFFRVSRGEEKKKSRQALTISVCFCVCLFLPTMR